MISWVGVSADESGARIGWGRGGGGGGTQANSAAPKHFFQQKIIVFVPHFSKRTRGYAEFDVNKIFLFLLTIFKINIIIEKMFYCIVCNFKAMKNVKISTCLIRKTVISYILKKIWM